MNSKIPEDVLSAFYDRELSAAEEPAVKWHVQASPQAKQELHDYERMSQLLQELPQQTLPPEFASAVMQQAERESLIPINQAGLGESDSGWKRPTRRQWVLAASGAAAAAVVILLFAVHSTQENAQPIIARNDLRAVASKSAPAATPGPLVAKRKVADQPVAVLDKKARAAHPMLTGIGGGMGGMGGRRLGHAAAAPASSVGKQSPQLVFPADLKIAKVGEIIEALEQSDEQVAVVRLTVVNQAESLDGIQSLLLVRDARRPVQNQLEARKLRERFKDQKSDMSVHGKDGTNAPGDLICVFVEGTRDQLASVLQDVQRESHIQKAQLTNTISAAKLAQIAQSTGVPSEKSSSPPPQKPQRVVKIPAAAAYEILGVGSTLRKTESGHRAVATHAPPKREPSRVASRVERSFQVFFVIDDPSIARPETAGVYRSSGSNQQRSAVVAPRPLRASVPVPAKKVQ